MVALHAVPAVVRARALARRHEVDLLVEVLADVGDPEIARRPVEREPPRVAQAVRPDLGPAAARARTGCRRDRVRRGQGRVRVDAQHLAEQRVERLAVAARRVTRTLVVGGAAVADAHVEQAVGAERDLAAVVVRLRVRDARAARGADAGSARPSANAYSSSVGQSLRVGVVDVELRAVGREREAEEPALAARGDPAGQVEHGRRVEGAVADRDDLAALLGHVQRRVVRADGHRGRALRRRDPGQRARARRRGSRSASGRRRRRRGGARGRRGRGAGGPVVAGGRGVVAARARAGDHGQDARAGQDHEPPSHAPRVMVDPCGPGTRPGRASGNDSGADRRGVYDACG